MKFRIVNIIINLLAVIGVLSLVFIALAFWAAVTDEEYPDELHGLS